MISRTERGTVANWFWTIDKSLLTTFVIMIMIGLVMSFAASPSVAERIGLDGFHFTKRHAFFIIPTLLILVGTSFLNARLVRRVALIMLVGSIVLMVMTLFVGAEIKGSRRWISIAGFSLQPSEFMKPAFVVLSAWLFSERSRNPEVPGNMFAILLFAIVVVLLIAQPDLGQTMLITAVWCAMFFLAGMPWVWISGLGLLGAVGFAAAYSALPHVAKRIDTFLTGEGNTYQVDTAKEAIINGDWFGKGPGEGTIKRILPDSHTDFVFSVAAEEFGIVFCIVLVALFAFIVLRSFVHAARETDEFTRLAISGLALLIGAQSMINIGVNLQLLPAKGMTLPFISYGGSSMMAVAIGVGFLLALTRHRPEKRARGKAMTPSRRVSTGVADAGVGAAG